MTTKPSIYTLCLFLLFIPAVACAGALDDYYLSRFAPQVKSAQLSAVSVATEEVHRHGDHCRTMLLRSLKRDWDQLEPETQQILAKQLARPALSGQRSFSSTHFTIYYAASGADVPSDLSDGDRDGTPDWIERVAETFERVYEVEVTQMGYRAPYPRSGYPVYLRDLANLPGGAVYGYAYSENSVPGTNGVTSYIEIDKDFNIGIYGGSSALDNLRVTAAHEFHHAIQYGYNYSFEMWYGEATATWIEDEVFDGPNQLYWYLNNYLSSSNSVSLNAKPGNNTEYGRWIFNRFLAERHSPELIREVWEDLGTRPLDWYNDVPTIPLMDTALGKRGTSVARELSTFAGTLYSGEWNTHTNDIDLIPVAAPLKEFGAYPATSTSVPSYNLALPAYAFAYYRFFPSATAPAHLKLDLPGFSSNATAVAYRKAVDGSVTSYPLDRSTGSISIPSFGIGQASEVVLAISSNGASGGVTYAFSTSSALQPTSALTVGFAGTGGGSINALSPVNSGIYCTAGSSCPPAQIADFNVVTLAATPDSNSIFGGWSAPCTVTGSTCQFTITSDVTATATFIASPRVRIAQGGGYSLISSAFASATNGATIQAREVTFPEALIFNTGRIVSLVGGYDAGYGTRDGLSVIDGSLRVRSGTLRVNGVAVR